MTDPRMSELFAQRPVASEFARGKGIPYAVRRLITVGVLLGILGGGAYAFIGRHGGGNSEIPTIKAEGTYKQKPQTPGGIDIPHQDVQVYQEMDPKAQTAVTVEHLLPPPEEPMVTVANPQNVGDGSKTSKEFLIQVQPKPVVVPPPATQEKTAERLDTPAASPAPSVQQAAVATQEPFPLQEATQGVEEQQPQALATNQRPGYMQIEKKSEPMPQPQPQTAAATTVQPAVTPPKAAAVSRETKKAVSGTKMVKIQLAALPDEVAAETHAKQLQGKYSSQLGDIRLHLQKADLGSKGIYFRIQSQAIAEDRANRVCSALRSMKMSCLLVRQ